jgi:protein-S-isoprenylcysteine O-methyltransferase Ste14
MSLWNWVTIGAVAFCWGLFIVVWVVGAIYNMFKAPRIQKSSIPYHWIVGIVLIGGALIFVPHHFWTLLRFNALWCQMLGLVILLCSTALTLWARQVLGLMWTSEPVVKEHHELRTDGPYALTRNPIYTGLLGMLLGTTLLRGFGEWTLIFIASIILLEVKIYAEEHLMKEAFGEEFAHYKQRVPQLIPGLKWHRG